MNKKNKKNLDHLTELQYKVTQESYTEAPFNNKYNSHYEKGIYVDVVDGRALFLSDDKFDSKSGWPSFTKPITKDVLLEFDDPKSPKIEGLIYKEIKSKDALSHLGHVFNDGPKDKGGMRYCINSASLNFIPYDKLEEKGYGEYKKYFKTKKEN
ncbi:peptide-methionine (R)-S-oxide reductase MsrB [[Mycoplasma] collis]|uniref:peptide-methionine (R)-S-oxide reductase MsrB n=1 Tax=[Mycoplasma] collis TaxID=2127 RepID=UPI00051C75B3|nr:peptide-methionine (R)-S-oxide reductase MsrB [[Mycoplasma] collis]